MNKFKEKWNSTQYRLSVRFIGLLIVTVLILSLSIIGITIVELYESTKGRTTLLIQSLENANAMDSAKWVESLKTYTAGENSPYYVRVMLDSGETLYSKDAEEIFTEFTQFKQLFFLNDILWTDELEPYYYTTLQKQNWQAMVLVDMEDQFELIEHILSLSLVTTVFVLIIGSIMTNRFAKKLSGSLKQMNQEIEALTLEEQEDHWLTEPTSPQEVKNVSKSFNQLLLNQRASLRREKQFVTDASHELRTPLAAIRGHVNLIIRRGNKHPEIIPKSIAYIDKESKRMETMVEQLLLLEKQTEATSQLDFSRIVKETMEELQIIIPQQLTSEIEKNILIKGNKDQMHQIVRNLLENATKYTAETAEINVTLKNEQDKNARLVISDNGLGISDADKPHIFERFYRVDQSRSSATSGSGIGLSIVKELVGRYDGTIELTDNLPQGCKFTVIFPLVN